MTSYSNNDQSKYCIQLIMYMIEQFWSTRSMIVILNYFMIASPVLVVIKLGSTNFILIHKNQPIRTLHQGYTMF